MKINKLVAFEIYEIRMELDIDGNEDHDWWLAGNFLQWIGPKSFGDYEIYSWFVQLEENLVKLQTSTEE